MIGAIIGDIAGSKWEFHNRFDKEFEFLAQDCFFTDDTVMTCAIAQAILDCGDDLTKAGEKAVEAMHRVGRPYPRCGYGGMFYQWMYSDECSPYGSFGNGAAMRVSPVGFAARSLEEAEQTAKLVTEVTHDHEEGIRSAQVTAGCIFLSRSGADKKELRDYVRSFGGFYAKDETVDGIRRRYVHTEIAQYTVPEAFNCFLEGKDYEDVIRNCISIGGDSDTLAAIAGGIAEAYYGVPDEYVKAAGKYLDDRLNGIVKAFRAKYPC